MASLSKLLPTLSGAKLVPLRRGESVTIDLDGQPVTLGPEDVLIGTEQASDWVAGDVAGVQLALSTVLNDELLREGMARDFVRQVQQLRKDADLEIEDRIQIAFSSPHAGVLLALREWHEYITQETLAETLQPLDTPPGEAREVLVGEQRVALLIERITR